MMFKPWLLVLETTNRCNLSCFYCSHKHIKKFYDMDFELYKRIVDETASFARAVDPNMWGEPLLYPKIVEAIRYAHEKGKKTILFTNATLLDKEMSKQLLDAGIDDIRFSIDGCDKESYESMSPNTSWDNVLSNVEDFLKLKREGNYKVKTVLAIVSTTVNVARLKEITDFWMKRVDDFSIASIKRIPTPSEIRDSMWISGKGFSCEKVFDHLSVKANGDLVPCCRDYLGSYVMANLNEVGALEGFNSEKFNQLRETMLSGERYPLMCRTCHSAREV